MIKWYHFGQMGSNGTSIYFSDHFQTNILGRRNAGMLFEQCNLQTIGILDYLQEYPSQFSTIKKTKQMKMGQKRHVKVSWRESYGLTVYMFCVHDFFGSLSRK